MPGDYFGQTPKLSVRLQRIARMVPFCGRVIDIGTDHAFIPIYLVAAGRCATAIASDIRQGPADLARRNISEYCMEDRISVMIQDGIGQIDVKEDDCLVISGMGGYEIQSILIKKPPVNAGTIILQPQKSLKELRKFLSGKGYQINEELIIKEKEHFYIAMNVTYTGVPYDLSTSGLITGQRLTADSHEIYIEYIKHLIKKLKKQIKGDPSLVEVLKKLEEEVSK